MNAHHAIAQGKVLKAQPDAPVERLEVGRPPAHSDAALEDILATALGKSSDFPKMIASLVEYGRTMTHGQIHQAAKDVFARIITEVMEEHRFSFIASRGASHSGLPGTSKTALMREHKASDILERGIWQSVMQLISELNPGRAA